MTDVFLSLSFVNADFVRGVHERLPRGVARYFERSFERGEDLIQAMELGLDHTEVFVLFATRSSLASYAVQFELEEARRRSISGRIKKVLVFPIEPGVSFGELPQWMQKAWVPNAGESPADIARYLTTILLEPDRGLSVAAPNVVGRGATVDTVRRLAAAHLQKKKESPRILILPGITGIGRRTFSAYYIDIEALAILQGHLPRPQYRKVVAWAETRRAPLLQAWAMSRSDVNPGKIR